jgi:RNA polymerase sigma factor FliA
VHSPKDGLVRFLYLQLRNNIAAAISDLPERERLVMTLYYYEKFSLDQIGIAIGEPYIRASQIDASGLMNLRARLEDPVRKWQPSIHSSARSPDRRQMVRDL